jgi:transcriptional regulator with XRE-family HTH domain
LNTISRLLEKLKDREYRRAFVASQINIGIPFQIGALMKAPGRDWTQKELAARTGMLQPRISAMLKPGATRPNIETLRRLADAFDCGLQVRFVPFTELVTWSQRFSPDTFEVPDYASEDKEGRLEALATERAPVDIAVADHTLSFSLGFTWTQSFGKQPLAAVAAYSEESGQGSATVPLIQNGTSEAPWTVIAGGGLPTQLQITGR